MKYHISPYSSVDAPMMKKIDEVFYASLDSLSSTMIELPYKGDRIVMQVLLPNTRYGLVDVEDKLKNVDIQELFEKQQEKTVQLNKHLSILGLNNMFSPLADFSGITDERGLHVSHVVQKAFIEVNEEGTEAAAATGSLAVAFSSPVHQSFFIADHPFIFYLRDKETGMLLFQGRVINPLK